MAMPRYGLVCICLMCLYGHQVQAVEALPTPPLSVPPLDADHTELATVLRASVRPDGVDYASVQTMLPTLARYRVQLAQAPDPTDRQERLSFYINAYNALTLALVAEKLPPANRTWPAWSITVIGPPAGNAWKGFSYVVAGTPRTLDEIEHRLLRPLGEPRIHFAINCASQSCPALAAEPYRVATLDAQLATATANFVASPYHLRLADGRLRVNPLLEWFGDDFTAAGGVRAFLRAHVPPGPTATFLAGNEPLQYFLYDWRLNLAGASQ